jgi:hypothetical protein
MKKYKLKNKTKAQGKFAGALIGAGLGAATSILSMMQQAKFQKQNLAAQQLAAQRAQTQADTQALKSDNAMYGQNMLAASSVLQQDYNYNKPLEMQSYAHGGTVNNPNLIAVSRGEALDTPHGIKRAHGKGTAFSDSIPVDASNVGAVFSNYTNPYTGNTFANDASEIDRMFPNRSKDKDWLSSKTMERREMLKQRLKSALLAQQQETTGDIPDVEREFHEGETVQGYAKGGSVYARRKANAAKMLEYRKANNMGTTTRTGTNRWYNKDYGEVAYEGGSLPEITITPKVKSKPKNTYVDKQRKAAELLQYRKDNNFGTATSTGSNSVYKNRNSNPATREAKERATRLNKKYEENNGGTGITSLPEVAITPKAKQQAPFGNGKYNIIPDLQREERNVVYNRLLNKYVEYLDYKYFSVPNGKFGVDDREIERREQLPVVKRMQAACFRDGIKDAPYVYSDIADFKRAEILEREQQLAKIRNNPATISRPAPQSLIPPTSTAAPAQAPIQRTVQKAVNRPVSKTSDINKQALLGELLKLQVPTVNEAALIDLIPRDIDIEGANYARQPIEPGLSPEDRQLITGYARGGAVYQGGFKPASIMYSEPTWWPQSEFNMPTGYESAKFQQDYDINRNPNADYFNNIYGGQHKWSPTNQIPWGEASALNTTQPTTQPTTPQSSSLGMQGWSSIAGAAMSALPAAYSLWYGSQKPDEYEPVEMARVSNPYEGNIMSLLNSRRFDVEPYLNQIKRQRASSNYAARDVGNLGTYRALRQSADTQAQNQLAQLYGQKNQLEGQWKAEAANTLAALGGKQQHYDSQREMYNAHARESALQFNREEQLRRQNALSAGVLGFGQWGNNLGQVISNEYNTIAERARQAQMMDILSKAFNLKRKP